MPRGDGTGPDGAGSITGRGAGFCAGYNIPGYANQVRGGRDGEFGGGRGFGGRGWMNRFYATGVPFNRLGFQPRSDSNDPNDNHAESELRMLKRQAEFMKREMDLVNSRITELESLSSEKK